MKDAFGIKLFKYFKIQARIFEKQIVAIHQSPTKKGVHQLRITTRRVRAALWLIEHGSPKLSFGKLKTDLRRLGRTLGQLRELDVAIQDATEYQLRSKKLKKRRNAVRKALLKQTNRKHWKNIENHLNKTLIKIQKHQDQTIPSGVTLLRKKIFLWTKKPLATEDDFHRLRIMTKKARYILETMGKPAQPLRNLQDVLGKGHDLEVLQTLSKGNSQLRDAAKEQYRKAQKMVRPTIRFAMRVTPA